MSPENRVQSKAISEFAQAIGDEPLSKTAARKISVSGGKLKLEPENVKNGLARLVLTLVRFLHEVLEKQAIRKMDSGALTDEEIERLGLALMKQSEEISRIAKEFGLEESELNLDLGPLGKLV